MKIFWFKREGKKALGGIEVENDNIEKDGYIYGYGKDLESARKDAEMGLEYDDIDFDKYEENDTKKDWYKVIWDKEEELCTIKLI